MACGGTVVVFFFWGVASGVRDVSYIFCEARTMWQKHISLIDMLMLLQEVLATPMLLATLISVNKIQACTYKIHTD